MELTTRQKGKLIGATAVGLIGLAIAMNKNAKVGTKIIATVVGAGIGYAGGIVATAT